MDGIIVVVLGLAVVRLMTVLAEREALQRPVPVNSLRQSAPVASPIIVPDPIAEAQHRENMRRYWEQQRAAQRNPEASLPVPDGLTPAQWAVERATSGILACAHATQRRLRGQEGWSSEWSRTGAGIAALTCAIGYSPLAIFGAVFGGHAPNVTERLYLSDEEARTIPQPQPRATAADEYR